MRFLLPLIVVFLALGSPAAAAQDRDAQDNESLARGQFELGTAALGEGSFVVAEHHLRRALEHHAEPAIAYNLARAREGMGQLLSAVQVLEELRSGAYGELLPEPQAEVDLLRAALLARLARLTVSVEGPPNHLLFIDDRVTAEPAPLVLDPGRHEVRAEAEGFAPATRMVDLPDGANTDVRLVLTGLHGELEPAPAASSLLESPAFWLTVTGVLLIVGAIVAAAILTDTSNSTDPEGLIMDDIYGVTFTLRRNPW